MVWSLLAVLILLALRRMPEGVERWGWVREILRTPRKLLILAGAAAAISVNWFVYIWSVNSGHTVEPRSGTSSTRW